MSARYIRLIRYCNIYRKTMRLYVVSMYRKINWNHVVFNKKYTITGPIMAASIWGAQEEPSLTKKEILLAKADALFDQGKYKNIYQLLDDYKNSKEVDILWRLSRALYKMAETAASEAEVKNLVFEGYEIISRAMEIDANNFAVHKWMAVLLDKKSECLGMKERIKNIGIVKKHMLQASEINPKDATMYYMLGQWCYSVSELTWYERKIASALFATPPDSTYEEALKYFQQAESVDPMFYSYNLLMIGKTYLRLKNTDEAKKFLQIASEYRGNSNEDHKAKQEAMNLLSKLS